MKLTSALTSLRTLLCLSWTPFCISCIWMSKWRSVKTTMQTLLHAISKLWSSGWFSCSAWHSAQSNHFRPTWNEAPQRRIDVTQRKHTAWWPNGDLSVQYMFTVFKSAPEKTSPVKDLPTTCSTNRCNYGLPSDNLPCRWYMTCSARTWICCWEDA